MSMFISLFCILIGTAFVLEAWEGSTPGGIQDQVVRSLKLTQ